MGPRPELIVPLEAAARHEEARIGGKALGLARLIGAGHRVPRGFCIPVEAYERFVVENEIDGVLRMELGRKSFSDMRWEELWDAALRLRSAFIAGDMPGDVREAIVDAHRRLSPAAMAVRSSAPGEDSGDRSYAGLHESLVGVVGEEALLDAVRVVWASLWSDAALLYRQELDMHPRRSRMAVVVQELVRESVSGVGFGVDPREPGSDRQIVEAVPGLCQDLVNGAVDPDRWILKRSSGEIIEWRPGERGGGEESPVLERPDLELLHRTLHDVEELIGRPADVEWTGRQAGLVLLQARPVTWRADPREDDRARYLSLRPGRERLAALCHRVTAERIPALEREAAALAAEGIEDRDDAGLADAIEARAETLRRWKEIYWDEFIPFAHGVRQLGLYYNDAVRPDDPYEFVDLLRSQPMIALERNALLERLAVTVRRDDSLRARLEEMRDSGGIATREGWEAAADAIAVDETGAGFVEDFRSLLDDYMDVAFDGARLDRRPDLAIGVVLELAAGEERGLRPEDGRPQRRETRLFEAVGPERRDEALDVLRVGRLSWKLRDDDNILVGRLENQLRRALDLGVARLVEGGRLPAAATAGPAAAGAIASALRDPAAAVEIPPEPTRSPGEAVAPGETPRQLTGQPASPGITTGRVRVVAGLDDIGAFRSGEVLVCDAIQPTMTHLLPLASAVVERRGGMLIHGAIIARELGVPCVNGVTAATERLRNGDVVTVDGDLGIVTVGPPEFELELGPGR